MPIQTFSIIRAQEESPLTCDELRKILSSAHKSSEWQVMDTDTEVDRLKKLTICGCDGQCEHYGRAEAAEVDISNLLAIIHRDGGHYQEEHGRDKALEDAKVDVAALLDIKDRFKEMDGVCVEAANKLESLAREFSSPRYTDRHGDGPVCKQLAEKMRKISDKHFPSQMR